MREPGADGKNGLGCLGWLGAPIFLVWFYFLTQSVRQTLRWLPLAIDPVSARVVVTGLETEAHTNLRGYTTTTAYARWRLVGEREVHRLEIDYRQYDELKAQEEQHRWMSIVYRRGNPEEAWGTESLQPPWDYFFAVGVFVWAGVIVVPFLPIKRQSRPSSSN